MDIMMWMRSQWDRLLAGAALVAGAVVLILGWRGVSGTAYPAEQLPYVISAGLGGLFLLGIATALWLSADLHDEWRKLDRLEQAIRESARDEHDGADFASSDEPDASEASRSLGDSVTARLPRAAVDGA